MKRYGKPASGMMLLLALASAPSYSQVLSKEQSASVVATVIRVDPQKDNLQLFLKNDAGNPFNTFSDLAVWLKRKKHLTLTFAMNAGMYKADYSPVGLFVSNGRELSPLNLSSGSGNFFLKPNGVLLLSKRKARIVESSEYDLPVEEIDFATQSGPLLVRQGIIHMEFKPGSASRLIRNGAGITENGELIFAISEMPVNFRDFAEFFRDVLKCPDALYLDGTVSGIYAPELKRNDAKYPLGPMIGIVKR